MVTRKRRHVAKGQGFELDRFSPLLDDEPTQPVQQTFVFKAKVWRWKSSGGWHFVTLPASTAAKVRAACVSTKRGGWGSIPVRVKIGDTEWKTALFPARRNEVLPVCDQGGRAQGGRYCRWEPDYGDGDFALKEIRF